MSNGRLDALLSQRLEVAVRRPSIVMWSRLEPRPRSPRFDRSLRAEVRDALWMLTRQWQLGEFQAEDAGSAVFAKVRLETSRLSRYASRGRPATAYDAKVPLEARVEAEPAPTDFLMRIQAGRHWLRLLGTRQSIAEPGRRLSEKYRELFLMAFGLEPPADLEAEPLLSQPDLRRVLATAAGRAIDGVELASRLANGLGADEVTAGGLAVAAEDGPSVAELGASFVVSFRRLFGLPEEPGELAWVPEHLEYRCAVAAPEADGGQAVLVAEEYPGGRLDWHSFDIDPDPAARLEPAAGEAIEEEAPTAETVSFLPTEVRFGGMPNARWWELEDRRVRLAGLDAETTDIARLLFSEFALIYGNDWSYVPLVVPVGSLSRVRWLVVTDSFGDRTLLRAAVPAGRGRQRTWRMFSLSSVGDAERLDDRLFLPPTLAKALEGRPIESVNFLRDEMANMVWAVESVIPDGLGGGADGFEAAGHLRAALDRGRPAAEPAPDLVETEARIAYRLGTSVPENWIPFIPVHEPGSQRRIRLQRAAMTRPEAGGAVRIRPRGEILVPDPAPAASYFVQAFEVPRAGAIVRRSYQRTRSHDGSIALWLGRHKTSGLGEGSSGLGFDQVEPIEDEDVG